MPDLQEAVRVLQQVKLFQGVDRAALTVVANEARSIEVRRRRRAR